MKFLLTCLLTLSLLSATSVDNKIKKSKKQLSAKKIEYKKMDKQLSTVAKKIIKAKKEQKSLSKKLTSLEESIKKNQKTYDALKKKDDLLNKDLSMVTNTIEVKQKKFVDLVSKKFSMALALDELNQPTSESVMMKEVYEVYAKNNNDAIASLKKDIGTLKKKKSDLNMKKSTIKKSIDGYAAQRKEYEEKKKEQDKIVKNLARDKAIYKKRFYNIKASRKSLEKKLATLKIIKYNEEKAVKLQRKAEAKRIKDAKIKTVKNAKTVKRQAKAPVMSVPTRITNYKGGKTISPLRGARLIKKFGTYIDPIYKFKIFNKSITLKAPHSGSKVKNVLAGKVVFAENSGGMLGQVVIVEHAKGMHTIYAKLSRLAPGIHVGKQLSKGTVIGKVDNTLMFEVTKDNKHINPMKLIKL